MIRDDALSGMDAQAAALMRALMEQLARHTQELARLTSVVNGLSGKQVLAEGTHKCPRCPQWLTPDVAGNLPGHEINPHPSGRRSPMCRASGQSVEQLAKAVSR